MGWEGDRASRFFGSRSRVWAIWGNCGLSWPLYSQHFIRTSFTSLLVARLARLGLIPFPTCQMMASGGCCFQGHSPVSSSYHTVPKA